MSGPDSDWITVEETDDRRLAARIELALRAAGLEVRVRREAAEGERAMVEVQVPLNRFDDALEALEPFDDEGPSDAAPGRGPDR